MHTRMPEERQDGPHLWQAVQQRLAFVERIYGVGPGRPPRRGPGGLLPLSALRCVAVWLLRGGMVAQTTTGKKGTDIYRYGVYRCRFARTKGPTVCPHGRGHRQERLEGALLAKFRVAMTAPMIEALARMVNAQLEAAFQGHHARTAELVGELKRLEGETTLAGVRAEWAAIEKASALPPPRVHPAWVITKLERLEALLRRNPQCAKVEILKHLDGDLVIVPRPSSAGERRAEISGA